MSSGFYICRAVIAGGNDKTVAINSGASFVTKIRQFTNEARYTDRHKHVRSATAYVTTECG